MTREELAQLFEDAFSLWHSGAARDDPRRRTPRIPVTQTRRIQVVSFAHNGREVVVDRAVRIVDISADGLGISLREHVPVGAVVCFAFDSAAGERSYGVATVVHCVRQRNAYALGLTFHEDACTLEVESNGAEAPAPRAPGQPAERALSQFLNAADCVFRVLTGRHASRRELRRTSEGRQAIFVVEARLFRFSAYLYVDGRKLVCQSGALNDRLRNLYSNTALPTMVNLQGEGFSAWATLRANAVTAYSLEPELKIPPVPEALPVEAAPAFVA